MQKQKENLFSEKFQLLNSQEHSEEINWTSTDSSDCGNVSNNDRFTSANRPQKRKRKRKIKVHKNISNLDVTVVDACKDIKELAGSGQTPPLPSKTNISKLKISPIFVVSPVSPSYLPPKPSIKVEPLSPILICKTSQQQSSRRELNKSPILHLKYSSQKTSPNVRKKLFKVDRTGHNTKANDVDVIFKENECGQTINRIKDPGLRARKTTDISDNKILEESNFININRSLEKLLQEDDKSNIQIKIENVTLESSIKLEDPRQDNQELKIEQNSDDSFVMLKTTNSDLVKRVKTYFDSHFSSETASQHSIDSLTPNHDSKTSEEIEISPFVTQINSNQTSFNSEQEVASRNPSPLSSQSAEMGEKLKKIKYKKDGLAHRLNTLLKKQKANISLWQHERFLAGNSNFVIPKEQHLTFRIKKIYFKYGVYLLEAVDVNNTNLLILINAMYVQNTNLCEDTLLKIYEPYKIVEYQEDCKMIINVCKIETVTFKQ